MVLTNLSFQEDLLSIVVLAELSEFQQQLLFPCLVQKLECQILECLGDMSFPPSAESILFNSTKGKASPERMKPQSCWTFACLSWIFTSSPPDFVMLMTSRAILSDFFGFLDFREPAVFGPWVSCFKPKEGITMMNPSHLDIERCCNFDQRSEK